MTVRNIKQEMVDNWLGLNSTEDATNLSLEYWNESMDVVVSSSGSALAMRSPLRWGQAITGTGVSAFSWQYSTLPASPFVTLSAVLIDVYNGSTYDTYISTSSGNTAVTALQTFAAGRSKRLTIGNARAYAVNGTLAGQIVDISNYKIGIDPPAAAPTATIVAGGTLVLNVGVTVSYAYRNSVTTHVGKCSAASLTSGPTGANKTLRVAVVASAQGGVDGIVLFISIDGGANRFLLVDSAGATRTFSNATGNIDISAPMFLDTNTIETAFSNRPNDGAYFMFEHQNRIFMLSFQDSAELSRALIYSGLESIGIGVPTEAYPPLNIITIPGKAEAPVGGISTPVGALIFSDRDAYLLTGDISDSTVSAVNSLSVSYKLEPLRWGLGTRSPYSIQITPFGVIWMDQTKRMQLWPFQGFPLEVGLPIRNSMKAITDSNASRYKIEGTWFQYGEEQFYVLAASTDSNIAGNNQLFIVGLRQDPTTKQIVSSTAVSDIYARTIISHLDQDGAIRCLVCSGTDGTLYEILQFTAQGSGWGGVRGGANGIYFGITAGNFRQNQNFNYLHSIRYDGGSSSIQLSIRNMDSSNIETKTVEVLDQSCFALLDRYGVHSRIRFTFPTDDASRLEVRNMRMVYSVKGRSI